MLAFHIGPNYTFIISCSRLFIGVLNHQNFRWRLEFALPWRPWILENVVLRIPSSFLYFRMFHFIFNLFISLYINADWRTFSCGNSSLHNDFPPTPTTLGIRSGVRSKYLNKFSTEGILSYLNAPLQYIGLLIG